MHRPEPIDIDLRTGKTPFQKDMRKHYARAIVVVRWGGSILSLSKGAVELHSVEIGSVGGQQLSIGEAVDRMLTDKLGLVSSVKRQELIGQFNVGRGMPPVYLVAYFPNDEELEATLSREVLWLNRESVDGKVSEVPVKLLRLVMTMNQGDELGYGDDGLIIWTKEHAAATIKRNLRATKKQRSVA